MKFSVAPLAVAPFGRCHGVVFCTVNITGLCYAVPGPNISLDVKYLCKSSIFQLGKRQIQCLQTEDYLP